MYGVGTQTTETFRWTMHTNPHGYGLNAQTLPKALRYYLRVQDGRVFVGGDLSQAEARVVAYLSNCKDLITIFNDPTRSVHLENALAVFGHTVEKDTPEYTLAKAVVHASNYREGAKVFSTQSGLPISTTRRLLANYHRTRPELHIWHTQVWERIKTRGALTTPLGDTRTFYEAIGQFAITGRMSEQQWKDAIAWVPQTVVPHVLDLGLVGMAELRDMGMDIQFHHQGHDSFLCSIPIGQEQYFFDAVVPIYAAIKLACPGGALNIPQEYAVGYSFGDMLPYNGSSVSMEAWESAISKKLAKKPRDVQILEGAYGVHLKDWRPLYKCPACGNVGGHEWNCSLNQKGA